jgi:arylsulfatase A-like enzyme/Tfp pilus assembly protein PilF
VIGPSTRSRCGSRRASSLRAGRRYKQTLVVLLVAIAVACGRRAATRDPDLNVLLITIDTLRADALGAYGNATVSTPWIDRLANEGVRFDRAHAHSVVTLPSHASILSGRYPSVHGVRDNAGFRFPSDIDTMATLLKARGYRTGAFVSAFPLDTRFGLARGFDVYDDSYGKAAEKTAFHMPERPGGETVRVALGWIASQPQTSSNKWFAWVHVYEPHFPYRPPEPFASRYKSNPYLGEVAAADAVLGPLLGPILDGGENGRTLVVLTADHGESLGEHGEMTHGLFAYEATLHVPLVVYQPRLVGHRVVEAEVRHVDILPTIFDALGASPPPTDGRSLLDVARGARVEPSPSYFEALSASLNRGWAPLHGVVRGSLKYIDLPIPELYDLASDPAEAHNLMESRPDDVRVLRNVLATARAADREASPAGESPETRARLRSLGYVTGAAAKKMRFTEADDPKRLVDIDRRIDAVVTLYERGDLPGAIAAARDVVARRPDMPLALTHLAFLYNEAGDHQSAIAAIARALDLNPGAKDVAALLGAYMTEGGRAREAAARLAPYVDDPNPDEDVLIAYGVALASSGRPADALTAFDRARALDPANALPLIDAATVYLSGGDSRRAEEAFAEAVRIDPNAARAHNGLAIIAARRGDDAGAIAHWQRALAIEPGDYQTLYNLGDILVRMGRPDDARPYWERYVRTAPPALEARDIGRVRQWLGGRQSR